MEYLHETEINQLLRVAYEHNPEHHLALLLMYATGTRVSQALRLRRLTCSRPDHSRVQHSPAEGEAWILPQLSHRQVR